MALFYIIFLPLLVFLCGLYWFSVNTFNYWKKKGVPFAQPFPLFGNLKDTLLLKRNFFLVHQDLYNRFEGHRFVGIFMGRRPALLIRDPELVKAVLVKDFQHFHDRDIVRHPDINPLQENLFTVAGQKWRALRNTLSPTFTSGRLKKLFPLVEECSNNLIRNLQGPADREDIVEMKDIIGSFTTDVIGSCAFGLEMHALDDPNSEFRRMGRHVFEPSITRRLVLLVNLLLPELGKLLKLDDLGSGVSEFFMRAVKDLAEYRVKNNVVRDDLFQLLIQLRYKGTIDDEESKIRRSHEKKDNPQIELNDGLMAAHAYIFFLAGFETSSTAMSFTLHEMAVNPSIQMKLREEIDATLQENGGKLTYEAVMNMKYLDKVVSEALRKYTPVQFLRRGVTVPYTIPGTDVRLDKGVGIVVPIYAIHRDPKHYPDPERFDPERFSDEEKAKRHHYAYLPFGEGPRNCVAMRFGLLQTKMGLAALLSNYEFHVSERTDVPVRFSPASFVVASVSGAVLRITNRSSNA